MFDRFRARRSLFLLLGLRQKCSFFLFSVDFSLESVLPVLRVLVKPSQAKSIWAIAEPSRAVPTLSPPPTSSSAFSSHLLSSSSHLTFLNTDSSVFPSFPSSVANTLLTRALTLSFDSRHLQSVTSIHRSTNSFVAGGDSASAFASSHQDPAFQALPDHRRWDCFICPRQPQPTARVSHINAQDRLLPLLDSKPNLGSITRQLLLADNFPFLTPLHLASAPPHIGS